MEQALTPAEAVIEAFGGVKSLARALDEQLDIRSYDGVRRPVHPSMVSRWRSNPERRNVRSGLIPPRWHDPILDAAQRLGKDVRTDHLVYGYRRRGVS